MAFYGRSVPEVGVVQVVEVYRGGYVATPSASFTRPNDTTAYASGDLVANSTTAGSVAPLQIAAARFAGGNGIIRRVGIRKTGTSLTNAQFRVHIYRTAPTVANGDNGAYNANNNANWLGSFDVTVDQAHSDGAAGNAGPRVGQEVAFVVPTGTNVFVLLEARGAYTPAAQEVFTVQLEVVQS